MCSVNTDEYFTLFYRTLHNYMMWHVVRDMTPYLTKEFTDSGNGLTEAISG